MSEGVGERLRALQAELRGCARCPAMTGPPIVGRPTLSRVYLVGQAPGPREGALGRPFGWTAGRTLFQWTGSVGLDEEAFRSSVFIAAVCRCFPGKAPSAGGKAKGDRVPAPSEITACESWMRAELALLDPDLLLPVGRLAIGRFLPGAPLEAQVGRVHRVVVAGRERDVLPLPHPSGVSRWFRTEPGQSRLGEALALLAAHPAWSEAVAARQARETPR